MFQNFSKEISTKFTFSDLDNFINQCTSDFKGHIDVFHLQSMEINKLFFNTCKYQEELEVIHKKLMLANCFQTEVETVIEMINVTENELEYEVTNLENDIFHTHNVKGVALDIFRRNTYELAEKINTRLSNIKKIFNQIENDDLSRDDSSFDIITLILTAPLKILEHLEIEIYKLRDKVNHISFIQKAVLESLKLSIID